MWAARDKNGELHLFTVEKPYRYADSYWEDEIDFESNKVRIDDSLFPELTWDDEPIEVSLYPSMLCSVQEKLSESVDKYFDYVSHVQDIHPYDKAEEQRLYNEVCWRWQDWGDVKYDDQNTWDLNFDDYVGSKR